MEGKGFRELKPEFDAKNAVICGVSFDTVEENRAFREKFDFPFSLLCDTEQHFGRTMDAARPNGANAKRMTVVIGPDGNIRKVYDTVTPAEHPQEVLAAIS